MKKIFLVIPFLLMLLALPFVSANISIAANSTDKASIGSIGGLYPSTNMDYIGARGQEFKATSTAYITSITVYIQTFAGSTGAGLRITLCSVSGGVPDTFMENSTIDYISVMPSYVPVTFYFSGTTQLTAGQTYGFYIYAVSGNFSDGKYVAAAQNNGDNYGDGEMFYQQNNAWTALDTKDLDFDIQGSATLLTSTPSNNDSELWGEGVTQIFNTVFPIALIAIPAVIGWRFARAWGFFAGLNVAIVFLNVYGLLPLWSVIVIIVIDGLLLFAKAGFRE